MRLTSQKQSEAVIRKYNIGTRFIRRADFQLFNLNSCCHPEAELYQFHFLNICALLGNISTGERPPLFGALSLSYPHEYYLKAKSILSANERQTRK